MDQVNTPLRSFSSFSGSISPRSSCRQWRILSRRLGTSLDQTFDSESFLRPSSPSDLTVRSSASQISRSPVTPRAENKQKSIHSRRNLFGKLESVEGAVTNVVGVSGDTSLSSTTVKCSKTSTTIETRRTIVTSDSSASTQYCWNPIKKLKALVGNIITFLEAILISIYKMESLLVLTIFLSLIIYISILINNTQPVPFIDEIFHVRQARQYCRDNFSHWDPKITTPPGLYLTSFGLFKPYSIFTGFFGCSLSNLRATNILFTIGSSLTYYLYYRRVNSKSCRITPTPFFDAISTSLFPPLFFFTFLYYTDTGSFFFLLLTFYFGIVKSQYWLSSIAGIISLFFRQTNIVWIFFCAFAGLLKIGEREAAEHKGGHLGLFWRVGLKVIAKEGGYLLSGVGFLAFLYWNNGIVLGDRSAHQAGFHLAQLPYFLLFISFFGAPHLFTLENLKHFSQLAQKRIGLLATLFLVLSSSLGPQFTYVHPYLLADNRHYTFYLWRRFLSNADYPSLRYLILPVCLFTLCSIWKTINFTPEMRGGIRWQNFCLKFLFIFCTLVTIVPQQLIEFRYFIVPFLIWRVNLESRSKARLYLEILYFLGLNLVTVYIFWAKTFYHPDSTLVQRIIW